MEDEVVEDSPEDGTKDEVESALAKKTKLFSAKEFRAKLTSSQKLPALQRFLQLCTDLSEQDCILEYLESGGKCLELFQILETDSTIPPALILGILTHILLRITSDYPHYHSNASESCQYFLNRHLQLMNKMLTPNSTNQERKVILKFLTALITCNLKLAKDVLLSININSANLDVLTKPTGDKDSVRNAFSNFVVCFLVDGHHSTLMLLFEKKGFIPAVVNGLDQDPADSVCVVVTAFKEYILENPAISKTLKMKIFNTHIIKSIVNLYNWKGPQGPKNKEKIDEFDKSKVNECVHEFLLTLCTSPKNGVIFKDHSLGLGKKHQNSLMFTVLESLERPWEHSYASELVTKICGACPDLAKTMWAKLKEFLEPRPTKKWLNAVKFADELVKQLGPSCVDFCIKEFSPQKFAQIIQVLVIPSHVLKMLLPETYESKIVKHRVLKLLTSMLKAVGGHVNSARQNFKLDDFATFKTLLSDYLFRTFPNARMVLSEWNAIDETLPDTNFESYTIMNNLEVALDMLDIYQEVCPKLVQDLNVDLHQFLNVLEGNPAQIKIIKLFLLLEPSRFLPQSEIFDSTFTILLKFYYDSHLAGDVLRQLLHNSNIFEGSDIEINVWIDGILDVKKFDVSVASFLVEALTTTSGDIIKYLEALRRYGTSDDSVGINFKEILYGLRNDEFVAKKHCKHISLSPLILGALECFHHYHQQKNVKVYFDFVLVNLLHLQTSPTLLIDIVTQQQQISSNIFSYYDGWKGNLTALSKTRGRISTIQKFSAVLFGDSVDEFFKTENLDLYVDLKLNLVQMLVFYVCNLTNFESVDEQIFKNCSDSLKLLLSGDAKEPFLNVIFNHPLMLQLFSPSLFAKGALPYTRFLVDAVKFGQPPSDYLKPFRVKFANLVMKLLKKINEAKDVQTDGLSETIELFRFDQEQCTTFLTFFGASHNIFNETNIFAYKILVCVLEQFTKSRDFIPMSAEVFEGILTHLVTLNKNNCESGALAFAFHIYLEKFPHHTADITEDVFETIVTRTDFCKYNALLAAFLLKRLPFLTSFSKHISTICSKKGLILPLLEAALVHKPDDDFLQTVFKTFEPSIMKALQKPQKAGVHFENHYKAVGVLIEKFFDDSKCKSFIGKVQKFESSEVFHAYLLCTIFKKFDPSENAFLTLVNLQMNIFRKKTKADEDQTKLEKIVEIFQTYLQKSVIEFPKNEVFEVYCKFILKFGLSGRSSLLKLLNSLLRSMKFPEDEVNLLFEMTTSHSEFLNIVLGEDSECKFEVFDLISILCEQFTALMERNHIPLFLAAYHATVTPTDQKILTLLQMYETAASQTSFYDFKPFIWGQPAVTHYSVLKNIQHALWRQPKMHTVLELIQNECVEQTILQFRLELGITEVFDANSAKQIYDFGFILPLFTSLLAPENDVQLYSFVRSGGLSLTVCALSSFDENVRKGACQVLARFHQHLEANTGGMDRLLWLRFVEAICKGTAVLIDFRLSNLVSIFWARMALILTQPLHPLYMPLSQYLSAKSMLDLGRIPEFFTLLHSSDVRYVEHRKFILEIFRDGLRTEKDFQVVLHNMAFKFIMEMYHVVDFSTKLIILEIIKKASIVPGVIKILVLNNGLTSWLFKVSHDFNSNENSVTLLKLLEVLWTIWRVFDGEGNEAYNMFIIKNIMSNVIDKSVTYLSKELWVLLFKIVYDLVSKDNILNETQMRNIIKLSDDNFSKYLFRYGYRFGDDLCKRYEIKDYNYCIAMLTAKWTEINLKK